MTQSSPGGQAPMTPSDETLWSVLAHVGVSVVGFVGPLVIRWLVK